MVVTEDSIVGTVRTFRDGWNSRKALCILIGNGSGPQGESVRLVGNPVRGGGFAVSYIHSYDPGRGDAAAAYEYLARAFGGGIRALDVTSPEGLAFNMEMKARGIVTTIDVGIEGLEPATRTPAIP
jgi:hypothetical protein